jgi:uncharacterized membrane protein YphA (DoxX/SURF4 family)
MNKSHVIAGAPASRVRLIAYWVATAIIVLETALGSEWDLARIAFVREVFDRLGYPYYLLTIMGIWKILAVVALLAPRFPRVKEWAYAGIFLIYTGAAFSHFYMGQVQDAFSPLFLALMTIVSWGLRPESKQLGKGGAGIADHAGRQLWGKTGLVIYWVSTILTVLSVVPGGLAQLFHQHDNVVGMIQLRFPVYFLTVLGFWKVIGGVVLVLPRSGLAKEWAYAGIFFDLTGAAAAWGVCGNSAAHVIAPLVIAGIVVISWMTRPASRWAGKARSLSL